jgi:hypothetical protein
MTYWDAVQAGMRDELEKIAEIDLSGLSPRTVIERGQPAPLMQTSGLDKAFRVLDRYDAEQAVKTAAPFIPFNPDLPQVNRVAGKRKKKSADPSVAERTKSFAGHVVGGAGVGRMAGWATARHLPTTEAAKKLHHSRQWHGMAIGAGIGMTEFARKRIAERMAAKKDSEKNAAAFTSPGTQLKNSRQVGAQPNKTTLSTPGPNAISKRALGGL